MYRRVVITGIGAVTPLGNDVQSTWDGLKEGRSAVDYISLFDASEFPTKIAAEVKDFHPGALIEGVEPQDLLDRKTQFGVASARMAMQDADMIDAGIDPLRFGVALGSEARRRDLLLWVAAKSRNIEEALSGITPIDHLRFSPFLLSSLLSQLYTARGPNMTISSACASGTQAIGYAFDKIRLGDADIMLTGGCDSLIDPMVVTGFNLLGALSTNNENPKKASRPFDLKRDGFILGEGAGILVLEELSHARRRGARVYAEMIGYGASSNAWRITDSPPDGQGAYLSMKFALEDAGIAPNEVDYINAHGTSTLQNDKSETAAIKRCFGDHAYRLAVSSTKSMMGHLVNAGGAVELIVCVLSVKENVLTPTINYEFPDAECDLDYVPNRARRAEVRTALSNSFGFGGCNSSLLVRRFEE
jgi:3-oxoacyl-[acyl-carrier-protein] synthase II